MKARLARTEEVTWDKLKCGMMEAAKKVCGTNRGRKDGRNLVVRGVGADSSQI